MKNFNLFLLLFFTFNLSFSQTIIRTEITNRENIYLATNITGNLLGLPNDEGIKITVENNLMNFEFEFVYKEEVIYRGSISKPSYYEVSHSATYRTYIDFTLDYKVLDTETILNLIEKRLLKTKETKEGNKFLYNDNLDLVNHKTGKLIQKLGDEIIIKYYKINYVK